MSARDDAHEKLITAAWQMIMDASCRESKLAAFEEMRDLVKTRSDQRVREMERRIEGLR